MWVLECDGNLLGGRSIWLRPGRTFLFGRTGSARTSPNERALHITSKGVSRKHLILTVKPVDPGSGLQASARSEVQLTDESKFGTWLDYHKFNRETLSLTRSAHTIKLGNYEQIFKVTWRPVVLSFSYSDKERSRNNDVLAPFQGRLEPLDIKTIHPFVVGATTHVIGAKRNVPKVLQALVNGCRVVTEAYVDAVVAASASPGCEDDGQTPLPSPLESDFDANWPDSLAFVPPPGKEPVPRTSEFFAPDITRGSTFEGFTFVFADQSQYDQLNDPISHGGGKCQLFKIEYGKSTVREFVDFAKTSAGKDGAVDFNAHGGIVVVRFRPKQPQYEDWAARFCSGVDLALGQRSIEQNEFLDAILLKNANTLKRPLGEDSRPVSTAPVSRAETVKPNSQQEQQAGSPDIPTSNAAEEVSATPEEPSAESRNLSRFKTRRKIQSRFETFSDFDADDGAKYRLSPEAESMDDLVSQQSRAGATQHQPATADTESQSLFVPDSAPSQARQTGQTRKRLAPPSEEEINPDEAIDNLLPANHALKKRRLETGGHDIFDRASPEATTQISATAAETDKSPGKGKPKTARQAAREEQATFRSAARHHAAEVDKSKDGVLARAQDDGDQNILQEMRDPETIAELARLVIIEDMDIPDRSSAKRKPSARGTRARRDIAADAAGNEVETSRDKGERWDDAWNGRKNFKRFRRKGETQANRGTRVIVPLEEAKVASSGLGDSYFLDDSSSSRQRGKARQGDTATNDDDAQRVVFDEDSAQGPSAPAEQAATGRRKGKRPASSAGASQQPSSKRSRTAAASSQAVVTVADDSDDSSSEDELRFKLRRRK